MDGKVFQNIKPPTPARNTSSVQLSTWGRLEDQATYGFYNFFDVLIATFSNKS